MAVRHEPVQVFSGPPTHSGVDYEWQSQLALKAADGQFKTYTKLELKTPGHLVALSRDGAHKNGRQCHQCSNFVQPDVLVEVGLRDRLGTRPIDGKSVGEDYRKVKDWRQQPIWDDVVDVVFGWENTSIVTHEPAHLSIRLPGSDVEGTSCEGVGDGDIGVRYILNDRE